MSKQIEFSIQGNVRMVQLTPPRNGSESQVLLRCIAVRTRLLDDYHMPTSITNSTPTNASGTTQAPQQHYARINRVP